MRMTPRIEVFVFQQTADDTLIWLPFYVAGGSIQGIQDQHQAGEAEHHNGKTSVFIDKRPVKEPYQEGKKDIDRYPFNEIP